MTGVQLSKADAKVLAQVFDPESAPEKTEILVDPTAPLDRHIQDPILLATLKQREAEAIRTVEAAMTPNTTSAAKDAAFHIALAMLNKLICEYPAYASARNNCAQLRRWRFGDRNLLCQRQSNFSAERQEAAIAIVTDLNKCISLASPAKPIDAVAPAQGRVLAQAHTQLGAVLHAAGKDVAEFSQPDEANSTSELVLTPPFDSWTQSTQFEEEASRLFYLGGLYGNEVAKALAVHTNPHAKLCGNIVQEAMRKEIASMQG